jgi:hypothetical protein
MLDPESHTNAKCEFHSKTRTKRTTKLILSLLYCVTAIWISPPQWISPSKGSIFLGATHTFGGLMPEKPTAEPPLGANFVESETIPSYATVYPIPVTSANQFGPSEIAERAVRAESEAMENASKPTWGENGSNYGDD